MAGLTKDAFGTSAEQNTSLVSAIINNDDEQVTRLLKQGIDANGRHMGMTFLYWAVDSRNITIVQELLSAGANINARSGPASRTALHQAVRDGDVKLVRFLLRHGADTKARTTHGRTPLDYATNPPAPLSVPPNAEEIVKLLGG